MKLGFTCKEISHTEFYCSFWPSPAVMKSYRCEGKSGVSAGKGGRGGCGGVGGNAGKYFAIGLERPTEFNITNQSGKRTLEKHLGLDLRLDSD